MDDMNKKTLAILLISFLLIAIPATVYAQLDFDVHCEELNPTWAELRLSAVEYELWQYTTYKTTDSFTITTGAFDYNSQGHISSVDWSSSLRGVEAVIWETNFIDGDWVQFFNNWTISGTATCYGAQFCKPLTEIAWCYQYAPTAVELESFEVGRPSIMSWLMDVLNN
jgi:hypothetical protein